jgi:hypothetical protein
VRRGRHSDAVVRHRPIRQSPALAQPGTELGRRYHGGWDANQPEDQDIAKHLARVSHFESRQYIPFVGMHRTKLESARSGATFVQGSPVVLGIHPAWCRRCCGAVPGAPATRARRGGHPHHGQCSDPAPAQDVGDRPQQDYRSSHIDQMRSLVRRSSSAAIAALEPDAGEAGGALTAAA